MGDLAVRFGKEVRSRRRARGMTQAQLAEAADLSLEWIGRIERGEGKPSLDVLEALAPALETTIADLFAPMSDRHRHESRIGTLLAGCTDDELTWIENMVRSALAYPRG